MLSDAEPVQDVLGPIICPTDPLQCLWERLFLISKLHSGQRV